MKCVKCGAGLYTKETRNAEDVVVRIRICSECGRMYYTKETLVDYDEGCMLMSKGRKEVKERLFAYSNRKNVLKEDKK